eukprot:COSAG04_NODE_24404_length_322_cov_1.107623_1_plen_107_part_11
MMLTRSWKGWKGRAGSTGYAPLACTRGGLAWLAGSPAPMHGSRRMATRSATVPAKVLTSLITRQGSRSVGDLLCIVREHGAEMNHIHASVVWSHASRLFHEAQAEPD